MSFQGADVSSLDRLAQRTQQGADYARKIVIALKIVVAALRAMSWTGFAAAYAAYLENVVIPWVERTGDALERFANVLRMASALQKSVSEDSPQIAIPASAYHSPGMPDVSAANSPMLRQPDVTVWNGDLQAIAEGGGAVIIVPGALGSTDSTGACGAEGGATPRTTLPIGPQTPWAGQERPGGLSVGGGSIGPVVSPAGGLPASPIPAGHGSGGATGAGGLGSGSIGGGSIGGGAFGGGSSVGAGGSTPGGVGGAGFIGAAGSAGSGSSGGSSGGLIGGGSGAGAGSALGGPGALGSSSAGGTGSGGGAIGGSGSLGGGSGSGAIGGSGSLGGGSVGTGSGGGALGGGSAGTGSGGGALGGGSAGGTGSGSGALGGSGSLGGGSAGGTGSGSGATGAGTGAGLGESVGRANPLAGGDPSVTHTSVGSAGGSGSPQAATAPLHVVDTRTGGGINPAFMAAPIGLAGLGTAALGALKAKDAAGVLDGEGGDDD